MSSKQLVLFKKVDARKLDSVLTELHNQIYALKHFALIIETSDSRNRAFNLTLDAMRTTVDLCAGLSDTSLKYLHWKKNQWEKLKVYEPYYAALEPRSSFRLYEIASDYKSRSNAILLRLRACLRDSGIPVPKEADEITVLLTKITKQLKHEGFEL